MILTPMRTVCYLTIWLVKSWNWVQRQGLGCGNPFCSLRRSMGPWLSAPPADDKL